MSVNGFNVQNNLYSINSTGVNAVNLYFVRDYVKFHYTFNFNVSKTPEYSIIFTDATPRNKVTIEDNKLTIIDEEDLIVSVYYEIFDKNNESSTQSINVELSTENIVQIDSAVGGRIRLSVLNKGECSIIISVSSDPNTVLELSIEVK